MAYLDVANGAATATFPCAASNPVADTKPALSALEWSVVALAQKDSMASLKRPGKMAVAMGKLFRPRTNPELADPKLEALRRIAVLAWHRGYAIASHEIHAFMSAGFSLAQYELVLGSISRGRNALNQRA